MEIFLLKNDLDYVCKEEERENNKLKRFAKITN